MKIKKVLAPAVMAVFVFGRSSVLSSCSKDDSSKNTIVNGGGTGTSAVPFLGTYTYTGSYGGTNTLEVLNALP